MILRLKVKNLFNAPEEYKRQSKMIYRVFPWLINQSVTIESNGARKVIHKAGNSATNIVEWRWKRYLRGTERSCA
jgi:hypothetical protein